jgi:protein-disulfide isomerase
MLNRFSLLLLFAFTACEVENISRIEEKPAPVVPSSAPAAIVAPAPVVEAPKPTPKKIASPFIGNELAKVTIVAFSDYQCPYCAKAEATLQALQAQFGSDLRIVWRDLPLESIHKSAKPAAIAARAAAKQGNSYYYALRGILFTNSKTLPLDAALYESYASTVPGLDVEQWKKDITDPLVAAFVSADLTFATSLGVKSTPNFFINGEMVRGAQTKEKFEEVVRRQLIRADAVLAAGTPIENLYDELTKSGATTIIIKGEPPGTIYKVPLD